MITLFCMILCMAFVVAILGLGVWFMGIVLMILGCINIWRSKWLEPNDYKDKEHMERVRKRTRSKATIQIVIGFIIFILFLV